jgi:hypothetical protein
MAILEIARIQLRRGLENVDGVPTLAPGELGWAQDTENLWIGKSTDEGAADNFNTRILTEKDLNLFESIRILDDSNQHITLENSVGDEWSVDIDSTGNFRIRNISGGGSIVSQASRTWVPEFSTSAGSLTTVTVGAARYERVGAFVQFTLTCTITDNGTGASIFRFTLPENALYAGAASGVNASTARGLSVYWPASSNLVSVVRASDSSYPVVTGDVLRISGMFAVA